MPPRHSRGHRDNNESEITDFLRRANIRYFLLPEGAGADILIYLRPMMLIEVKNPKRSPSAQALTETEKETQSFCLAMGIPYRVVKTPEEMASITNKWIEENSERMI